MLHITSLMFLNSLGSTYFQSSTFAGKIKIFTYNGSQTIEDNT